MLVVYEKLLERSLLRKRWILGSESLRIHFSLGILVMGGNQAAGVGILPYLTYFIKFQSFQVFLVLNSLY